jgi:hypothetical protein
VATDLENDHLVSTFWDPMRRLRAIERRLRRAQRDRCAAALREVLHPYLLRSSYWSRSHLKPHGPPDALFADLTKPAVVNLLDYLYSTVHSFRAVSITDGAGSRS